MVEGGGGYVTPLTAGGRQQRGGARDQVLQARNPFPASPPIPLITSDCIVVVVAAATAAPAIRKHPEPR